MPSLPLAADSRRSRRKTDAILEGAMREFLHNGFAAASMDRVAAAAGVSKATVYSHFNDKASLFQALTRSLITRRVQSVFTGLEPPAGAGMARERLLALAQRLLAVRSEQPELLRFLRLVIGESGRFPDLARGFSLEVERQVLGRLGLLFDQLEAGRQATPTLSRPDTQPAPSAGHNLSAAAELKARIFLGALLHSVLFQDVLHGGEATPLDRAAFAEGLVRHLCDPSERSGGGTGSDGQCLATGLPT